MTGLGEGFSDQITKQTDLFNRAAPERIGDARSWQEGFLGVRIYDRLTYRLKGRLVFLAILILLAGLLIAGRLFSLQVLEGEKNRVLADNNRVFTKVSMPQRGTILSREGRVLAGARPGYRILLVWAALSSEEVEVVGNLLKKHLNLSEGLVEEAFSRAREAPFSAVTVRNDISHAQKIVLSSLLPDSPGILIEESLIRDYPAGKPFSSLLGFLGKLDAQQLRDMDFYSYRVDDLLGRDGLEKQYEQDLRGRGKKRLIEINALGEEVKVIREVPGVVGDDLVLTVDYNWQEEFQRRLAKAVEEYAATGGVVVMQEADTGRIVALNNFPTYDNNIFSGEIDRAAYRSLLRDEGRPLYNRAVAGSYPPGSTVKPIVAAAALEQGIVDRDTIISDYPQVIRIGSWEFPDWTVSWGARPHGYINVREAIAFSCDTFFYKIGGGYSGSCGGHSRGCQTEGLGVDEIVRYYREFGFGRPTGIDLPGELTGLVPDPDWKEQHRDEGWYLGNTYHLSIGQGDMLTSPLQVVNYVSAVANGGTLWQPRLALRIQKDGQVLKEIAPTVGVELAVNGSTLKTVREGMALSVSDGIIYPLRDAPFKVAAKTGTAEFGTKNSQGEYATHAWVTGYFPVEKPEFSFVVLLESGGKSNNAAELARELIDWVAQQE